MLTNKASIEELQAVNDSKASVREMSEGFNKLE